MLVLLSFLWSNHTAYSSFWFLCPHLPFFSFSSLLACVTIFPPVCLPPSACASLHFFPQLSPRTLLPRPKGILVLNLDRLRYWEKLQPQEPRLPPGWSFTPPPTTSPYLFQRVACREMGGGGCQLQETEVWGKNEPRRSPWRRRRCLSRRVGGDRKLFLL